MVLGLKFFERCSQLGGNHKRKIHMVSVVTSTKRIRGIRIQSTCLMVKAEQLELYMETATVSQLNSYNHISHFTSYELTEE